MPKAARDAVRTRRLFKLLHLDGGIKVDLIVGKTTPFRRLELERRIAVQVGDVRTLLEGEPDVTYRRRWAAELGVATQMDGALK
jgi:hypothetical protein